MGVLFRYDDAADSMGRQPAASGWRYDETSSGTGASESVSAFPGSVW